MKILKVLGGVLEERGWPRERVARERESEEGVRWVVGVKGVSGVDPEAPRKYLDISTKYVDIFTIHSVCVSVCVEWERVFEWGEGERVFSGSVYERRKSA